MTRGKRMCLLVAAGGAGLVILALWLTGRHGEAPVTTMLRITVIPPEQRAFVAQEANSARFKYLVGKESGIKPFLAQKLVVSSAPDPTVLEARVGVLSKEEGERYVSAFVPILQDVCRTQAEIRLLAHTIR